MGKKESPVGDVKTSIKIPFLARCWWLILLILVTWEAEIRRIMV
jgi:hypothetical protein